MLKHLSQPLSFRAILLTVAILGALIVAVTGGQFVYRKIAGRPPAPADVQVAIWKFLEKETKRSEFKSSLNWNLSTNEASALSADESAPAKKRPKPRRPGSLWNPISQHFREQQQMAPSYEVIYRLIGEQLWIAGQLLAGTEAAQQQAGLVMANEASGYALKNAENAWLAARICQGYLWPHLDLVDGTQRGQLTPEQVLNTCDEAFKAAEETRNIVRNYQLLISKSTRPGRADMARFRLARVLQDHGDYKESLHYLRQIQNTNNAAVQQRIAMVEQQARQKKAGN